MSDTEAYDRTCPGCKQPTSSDDDARVCCGRCLAYHHAPCWQALDRSCGACCATETVADKDAARRTRDARLRAGLVVVSLGAVAVLAIASQVLPFWSPTCCVVGVVVCGTCVAAMPFLSRLTR